MPLTIWPDRARGIQRFCSGLSGVFKSQIATLDLDKSQRPERQFHIVVFPLRSLRRFLFACLRNTFAFLALGMVVVGKVEIQRHGGHRVPFGSTSSVFSVPLCFRIFPPKSLKFVRVLLETKRDTGERYDGVYWFRHELDNSHALLLTFTVEKII